MNMPKRLDEKIVNSAGVILGIFFLFIAFSPANAAKITNASDAMTRAKAGASANHTIGFISPSGIPEGATLSATFPVGFNAAGLTENDVDLLDDGLPVSTAPDCSGVEQASAVWTGNVLTLEICPGDGGAIAPGSIVGILIGTNAIDSGVGVNRVKNPAVPGTYNIAIDGSFGDAGAVPVIVTQDDQIGVSACVGEASCGAHFGSPAGIGAAAVPNPVPVISDIQVSEITATTAKITWQTDVVSNSYVIFGLNNDYDIVRGSDNIDLYHTVVLMGLSPETVFNFRVRSVSTYGEAAISASEQFKTLPKAAQPNVPPQISDIVVESVTGYDATVSWRTDVPTYSLLEYGRTDNYGAVIEDQQFETHHEATLGNLSPATIYHFRITATDDKGNRRLRPISRFQPSIPSPRLSRTFTPRTLRRIPSILFGVRTRTHRAVSSTALRTHTPRAKFWKLWVLR